MTFKISAFWIRIAALFLVRSGRSSAALLMMVVAAVATLIFLSALAIGVNDTMIRNSTGLYTGHISVSGLPQTVSPERLKTNETTDVLKRMVFPGEFVHQGRSQPASLVAVNPDAEKKRTAIWKKTVAGRYPRKDEKAVFLSRKMAEKLKLQPGDVVRFQKDTSSAFIPLTVSGIYQTGLEAIDGELAFCPMNAVSPAPKTWSAAVFIKEGRNPQKVIAQYRNTLPQGSMYKSWEELMPDLVQLIDLNYLSMSIVMVLVFCVVAVGITCTFIIFILKNLREYGIMKAMGVAGREIILLIFSEVLLLNLAADAIGVFAGVIVVLIVGQNGIDLSQFTSYNRYFTVSGVIFPRLTHYSLLGPPALAALFGMVSAVWPVVLVYRKQAADILRII